MFLQCACGEVFLLAKHFGEEWTAKQPNEFMDVFFRHHMHHPTTGFYDEHFRLVYENSSPKIIEEALRRR